MLAILIHDERFSTCKVETMTAIARELNQRLDKPVASSRELRSADLKMLETVLRATTADWLPKNQIEEGGSRR